MAHPVLVTDRAETHIRAIDEWWQEHRAAARHLFREELAAAFDLLAAVPQCGRGYAHPSVPDVRRVLLRATRFHVYYRVSMEAIVVLAIWSAVRETGPDLGSLGRS